MKFHEKGCRTRARYGAWLPCLALINHNGTLTKRQKFCRSRLPGRRCTAARLLLALRPLVGAAEAKEPAELAAVARPSLAKRVQQEEAPAPTRRSGFFGAGPSRVSPGLMLSENEFDDIFERAQDAREFIAALAPTGLLMVRELAILYVVVMLPVFLCFRGPRRWPWGLAAANFLVELSCVCDWRARQTTVRSGAVRRGPPARGPHGPLGERPGRRSRGACGVVLSLDVVVLQTHPMRRIAMGP